MGRFEIEACVALHSVVLFGSASLELDSHVAGEHEFGLLRCICDSRCHFQGNSGHLLLQGEKQRVIH